MERVMRSVCSVFGDTATTLGGGLLLLWVIFVVLHIRIRRRSIRFLSLPLLVVSFAILLGLERPAGLPEGATAGGMLGDWVYWSLKETALFGLARVLAWFAFLPALLLATDWLFVDYFAAAMGLHFEEEPAKPWRPAPAAHSRLAVPPARPRPFEPETRDKPAEGTRAADAPAAVPAPVPHPPPAGEAPRAVREERVAGAPAATPAAAVKGGPARAEERAADPPPEEEAARREPKPHGDPFPSGEALAFREALQVVRSEGKASLGLLQERLHVGYFFAARLMHRLEKAGVVTPPDGEGRRRVIRPGRDGGTDEPRAMQEG